MLLISVFVNRDSWDNLIQDLCAQRIISCQNHYRYLYMLSNQRCE